MYIWAVTVVYADGRVVNIPVKCATVGHALRLLFQLNNERLFDSDIERIDVRRVKEHQNAE